MTMSPGLRKLMLVVHLTVSVGWIGAVMAYLALVFAAMVAQGDAFVLTASTAMRLIGWSVIVPLALTSLLTGLIMALGTKWGLFRHYWVIFSLVLTSISVVVLLEHMHPASLLASATFAAHAMDASAVRRGLNSELLHAGLGLGVLLVVQVLNIYKPKGVTPYGWRKQQEQGPALPIESGAS